MLSKAISVTPHACCGRRGSNGRWCKILHTSHLAVPLAPTWVMQQHAAAVLHAACHRQHASWRELAVVHSMQAAADSAPRSLKRCSHQLWQRSTPQQASEAHTRCQREAGTQDTPPQLCSNMPPFVHRMGRAPGSRKLVAVLQCTHNQYIALHCLPPPCCPAGLCGRADAWTTQHVQKHTPNAHAHSLRTFTRLAV
jgi:hypothetical protein